nr:transposase [Halomonas sp. 328]
MCYVNNLIQENHPLWGKSSLLKIILFANSKGITSSREMQWCCETNILFKALSCDTVPHFTTLARLVSGHVEEIEALFDQVLLGNELFAIDGCKMSSNNALVQAPSPRPRARVPGSGSR